MNYCENCYVVSDQTRCPLCGTKRLRQVERDDFCLLTEKDSSYCNMLMDAFQENDIHCSAVPWGSGVRSKFALPLENYRLYVPFHSLEKAKNMILRIEDAETENLRNKLLERTEKLNVAPKTEKKLRKKLKLQPTETILDFCLGIIKSADRMKDEIPNSGGEHYVFCSSDEATLLLKAESCEILSVTKRKTRR